MSEKMNIKNLSQAERLKMAKQLLDSVWEEMRDGWIEGLTLLQIAMDCSIQSRRIAWLLNKKNDERHWKG